MVRSNTAPPSAAKPGWFIVRPVGIHPACTRPVGCADSPLHHATKARPADIPGDIQNPSTIPPDGLRNEDANVFQYLQIATGQWGSADSATWFPTESSALFYLEDFQHRNSEPLSVRFRCTNRLQTELRSAQFSSRRSAEAKFVGNTPRRPEKPLTGSTQPVFG